MWSRSPNGMQRGKVFPSSVKDGNLHSALSTPMSVNNDLTAVRATLTEGASNASILRVALDLKATDVALLPRIWKGHNRHVMSMEESLGWTRVTRPDKIMEKSQKELKEARRRRRRWNEKLENSAYLGPETHCPNCLAELVQRKSDPVRQPNSFCWTAGCYQFSNACAISVHLERRWKETLGPTTCWHSRNSACTHTIRSSLANAHPASESELPGQGEGQETCSLDGRSLSPTLTPTLITN